MDRPIPLDAVRVIEMYDGWTLQWHRSANGAHFAEDAANTPQVEDAIQVLHAANFTLWHEEDKARDPNASDSEVAGAKRTIDAVNQKRNDQIERCDALLLQALAKLDLPNVHAEPLSETPGLILDRLSILSLKRYHTMEEMARVDAPHGHVERNHERLQILELQRNELADSLNRLWQRVLRGERSFRLYRQLKMYNDPELNPVLYGNPIK